MDLVDARLEPALILLVEDSLLDAEILLRNFRKARFSTPLIHLRDGAAALDYLLRQGDYTDEARAPTPDLLLLDLNLPRVGGWDILVTMRADARLKTIPVVVMTSSEQDEEMVLRYEHGPNAVLRKPVDFYKLVEAIQSLSRLSFVLVRGTGQGL